MVTKPLTALQWKRRKEIEALIWDGRIAALVCRKAAMVTVAQTLDNLADIVEKYMEGLK